MNTVVSAFVLAVVSVSCLAQEASSTKLLDRKILSGIGLEKISPSWADPKRELFTKSVFSGADIGISVTSSSTAFQDWKNYSIDEFVYLLNGQAVLKSIDGEEQTFNKGDFFVVPKGFTGRWTTQGTSGDFLELALYTRKRGVQKDVNAYQPLRLDQSYLSGMKEANNGILFEGAELLISISSKTKNSSSKMSGSARDRMCYILNGMVEVSNKDGTSEVYYTGDFYAIPKGFEGEIVYKGFDIFRELIVEAIADL